MAEALMTYGVPGPQGIQGPTGATGPRGPTGPAGSAGSISVTYKVWDLTANQTGSLSMSIVPKLVLLRPVVCDYGAGVFIFPNRGYIEAGYGNPGNYARLTWNGGSTLTIAQGPPQALTIWGALIS